MNDMNSGKLEKMRDIFRETADIIDEILVLEAKEDNGEDVKEELESTLGRFMFKMIELQSLS